MKGHIINTLGFAEKIISVANTQFCNYSRRIVTDKKQMGVAVFQYSFIYKNKPLVEVGLWIILCWPLIWTIIPSSQCCRKNGTWENGHVPGLGWVSCMVCQVRVLASKQERIQEWVTEKWNQVYLTNLFREIYTPLSECWLSQKVSGSECESG